jgi:hypothetical protein
VLQKIDEVEMAIGHLISHGLRGSWRGGNLGRGRCA